jgi:hypothetical protein
LLFILGQPPVSISIDIVNDVPSLSPKAIRASVSTNYL